MTDSFKKIASSINRSSVDRKKEDSATKMRESPSKGKEDEFANMTKLEKIQAKEAALKERQKKSMNAWGETGE